MWLPMHKRPSFASKSRKAKPSIDFQQLLKKPKLEKLNNENVIVNGLEIGHSSMQGYRPHMEDEYIIESMTLPDHVIIAILDGEKFDKY
jgi:NOL1/NOP2/fmu family ribosome biogenesis protein